MLRRSVLTCGLGGLIGSLVTSAIAYGQRFAHPTRQRLYRVGSPVRIKGVEKPYDPIANVFFVTLGSDRIVTYMLHRSKDGFWDSRSANMIEPCEGTQYAEYNEVP